MPAPIGPRQISTSTSPAWMLSCLDRGDRRRLADEHLRRAGEAVTRRPASTTDGSIAVLLITAPSGARFPAGRHIVDARPRFAAASGDMITSSGSTPSRSRRRCRSARPPLGRFPPVELLAERAALDGEDRGVEQPGAPQVEHHLGHAAGEEHLNRSGDCAGRWAARRRAAARCG